MKERYYLEAVKEDVKNYIHEQVNLDFWKGRRGELEEELSDSLWCDDDVTGNGSGSYWGNRAKAEEVVKEHLSEVIEAVSEYDYSASEFGKLVLNEEWETLDVIARCHNLNWAIYEVLEEYEV